VRASTAWAKLVLLVLLGVVVVVVVVVVVGLGGVVRAVVRV
jgi:hypothetical protein